MPHPSSDWAATVQLWLAIGQIATGVVVTVCLWALATGRWAAKQEGDQEDVARAVERVERRVDGEHNERKRLVEHLNGQMGTLQTSHAVLEARVGRCEDDVKELRRKTFSGGQAIT